MTALSMRPTAVRLKVAYMATAFNSSAPNFPMFENCVPGNSLERMFNEGGTHPYTAMWNRIDDFYKHAGLEELCDDEVVQRYTDAFRIGFTHNGVKIAAQYVQAATKQWADNGWFRYEQQRSTRRGWAKKVGIGAVLLFAPV